MARSLCVLAAIFMSIVIVAHAGFSSWLPTPEPSATARDVCDWVGVNGGCSSCVHGTKGSCMWAKQVLNAEGLSVSYCELKEVVEEDIANDPNQYSDAASACPLDATKEPVIRDGIIPLMGDNILPKLAQELLSKWHDSDLTNYPNDTFVVDRSSRFGTLGVLIHPGPSGRTCTTLTTRSLFEKAIDAGNILSGSVNNEHDKHCARLLLSAYLSNRCPVYGRAISGICQSFADQIDKNCAASSVSGATSAFTPLRVVPNGTPHCLTSFPIQPSGEMEHLALLDRPASAEHPINYD